MPWLDDSLPTTSSAQKWKIALKHALLRRLSADQLDRSFRELGSRYSIPPSEVAKILLSFRARDVGSDDPLLFHYAQALLRTKAVYPAHLLLALLSTSRFKRHPQTDKPIKSSTGLPSCEERMLNMLTQMYISGEIAFRPSEAHDLVYALTLWMQAISNYETGKQLEDAALHTVDALSFGMYEALASLVITTLSSHHFRDASKQPWWNKRRDMVVSEMQDFATHVLLWMQSPLAGRLQVMSTMPPFLKTDDKGFPIFTDEQILSSVADLPIENSRAGLFIWLNACLCGRPLTDDMTMLAYLQARYPGNNQALVVDLLIAAFDVLTNALLRKESDQHVNVIRSFICNKAPHLFSIVSNYMATAMTIEACISMAFMAITMDALPPISAGATDVREKLKLTRLEFLQACALHGLVSENTISSVLQEPSMTLPRVNKYTKEGLLAQCSNNVGRLEPLIEELDGMFGNVGAIASCIVDTINNLCITKDTMSLKALCNMLIKKPSTLDIILQYTPTANLLLPLCNQLNGWTHDQDQTEFTPAYEEFASILLFVLVAVHRYGLARSDLGLLNDENFIARLLQDVAVSKSPSNLSDEQSSQLSKWIEGLYATDDSGEMGGISDEVMRHCPPQAFYQLVPNLFEQTVLARKTGVLPVKTFNGGLELLVEPFLLPSLVGGLGWLIQHSWEDHGDANILLQILDKLLKPSSSSQETKAMHKAILDIVADPLYRSLEALHQRQPEKKQVSPLMNILKPHLPRNRTLDATKDELRDWTKGGIANRVRTTARELVSWVTDVGPTPPPKYTHRLFTFGCAISGSIHIRDALVAEIKEQTAVGNGPLALDICCAMICAPITASSAQSTQSVRDALRLRTADIQKLLQAGAIEAEALVRLSRRVETQLAVNQMPQIPMALPIQDATADQVMAELGLTDDALGAPGPNVSLDPAGSLGVGTGADFNNAELNSVIDQAMAVDTGAGQGMGDLTATGGAMSGDVQNIFDDLDMGMGQDAQQPMLNADGSNANMSIDGQQNAEEDIFAGLDMSLGDDFNFS